MSAPWPIGPDRPERRRAAANDDALRLAEVNARLATAEAQMAALEARPALARAALKGFARGFLLVLFLVVVTGAVRWPWVQPVRRAKRIWGWFA